MIALTANALSGAREKYLSAGFDDYLSKPIDGKLLEQIVQNYLPFEKLQIIVEEIPVEKEEKQQMEIPETGTAESEADTHVLLDTVLGLKYSMDMEDMYRELLQMFCDMKEEKAGKLQEVFDTENWKDYVTAVHALKSTSLSIGGKAVSEKAFELEKAGKEGAGRR